jgi:hypothetical protein
MSKDFPVLTTGQYMDFWFDVRYFEAFQEFICGCNLLNFKQFSDCEVRLVPIPRSVSFYFFGRNMKDN